VDQTGRCRLCPPTLPRLRESILWRSVCGRQSRLRGYASGGRPGPYAVEAPSWKPKASWFPEVRVWRIPRSISREVSRASKDSAWHQPGRMGRPRSPRAFRALQPPGCSCGRSESAVPGETYFRSSERRRLGGVLVRGIRTLLEIPP
jgi:hypothetical protein